MVGIASASGVSARHAADKFGFAYATSDVERILQDPSINTIAILTRHNLHASQVLAALSAGKHTFCEKPLALLPEELGAIADALAARQSPLLMVGFNRRFAPFSVKLADFLHERGEPLVVQYRVNAGSLPPQHWLHDPAQGGGRIVGEACHFIDFLTFLVGQIPHSVSAAALPDGGHYHEDNAVLTFEFPDGSLGSVTYLANGDRAFPKERVEVFAAGQVAVLDDFHSLELVRDGRRSVHRSRLRQDKGHHAEWQAFSQAILSGGLPPIPYEHLIGVTRASLAALQAIRQRERIAIEQA
jgi:predicted dehydrogenase